MSSDEYAPTRPLSVAIPQATGPYCHRRPTLNEILANTSLPPWTLAAFMAYLSANLCLENLEFTMDAGRYQKHYAKMMAKAGEDGKPLPKDSEYVRLLWVRLIDAYIAPNGSREVNLPSSVRDPILNAATIPMPPMPETLTNAVTKTHELMEESVLQPFLNSVQPHTTTNSSSSWHNRTTDRYSDPVPAQPDYMPNFGRSRKTRNSPPPQATSNNSSSAPSRSTTKHRLPGKSNSSGSRLSTSLSNTSDASLSRANWSGSGQGMTDDSGSTGSPTTEGPMTPPVSPSASDLSGQAVMSPKHSRDSGMWKRLGRISGLKSGKKKSTDHDVR